MIDPLRKIEDVAQRLKASANNADAEGAHQAASEMRRLAGRLEDAVRKLRKGAGE